MGRCRGEVCIRADVLAAPEAHSAAAPASAAPGILLHARLAPSKERGQQEETIPAPPNFLSTSATNACRHSQHAHAPRRCRWPRARGARPAPCARCWPRAAPAARPATRRRRARAPRSSSPGPAPSSAASARGGWGWGWGDGLQGSAVICSSGGGGGHGTSAGEARHRALGETSCFQPRIRAARHPRHTKRTDRQWSLASLFTT